MAQLGVTGAIKCHNTRATCQDLDHFNTFASTNSPPNSPSEEADPVTLRFAISTDYLPKDIEAIPSITEVDVQPATISLGRDLGQRATVTVKIRDHPWSDTGEGFDKYVTERPYNPWEQGTFWGKFRARQPYLRGRNLRLIRGLLGQALEEMETRHYVVESFDGPTPDGIYTLIAKDVLKLAAGDRAQAPALSGGFLNAAITETDDQLTLSPSGIGDEEYPLSGYVAIGGKEIVEFIRQSPAGNNANTLLLLHFEGADGSTTFTDSSSYARTVTQIAPTAIDNAQFKFGSTSGVFNGGLTVADSNDWTFAGDFTVDGWTRHSGAFGSNRAIFGHGSSSTNNYECFVSSAGAITFRVISGGVTLITCTSAGGVMIADTWQHVALVRAGNVFTIYVNGVSVATTTDADAIPNYAGTFKIGLGDVSGVWFGWIDELRISNVARWSAGFTVSLVQYLDSEDVLYLIARAQFNTEAAAHQAQDRVQLCLQYSAQDPADIIYDLMTTFAGISPDYILLAAWQNETASFLDKVYTALIAEPTPVEKLISELIEQAALVIWWDDLDRLIRLQVLREIGLQVNRLTPDNILRETLDVAEQPDKRVSQVWTYFGQINPLAAQDDAANYRSTAATIDTEAETNYGTPAIKKIFSRWIPAFGKAVANRMNDLQLERFRNAPRRFNLELFRYSGEDSPLLGRGYRIESHILQDATGAQTSAPVQITRLNPTADRFIIEAEEMLFETIPDDPTQHPIIIDVDTLNIDLRDVHDALYGTPVSGDTVTCTIEAGVVVGSNNATVPAFDVGSWPAGITINLMVVGRIAGMGGVGGNGGTVSGLPGSAGGTALYVRYAVTLNSTGDIWGAGGGGGGGDALFTSEGSFGGSGGHGGAGRLSGVGGYGGGGELANGPNGSPGTDTAGGGNGAGAGGGPGLAGSTGVNHGFGGGAPGAAGKAIDGVSFVTIVSAGDIRGSQVN